MKFKLSIVFLCLCTFATAQFSDKDKSIIATNSIDLLKDYEELINNIGLTDNNDMEKMQGFSESFINLFINRKVLVYNDLDPNYILSEFYEVETYISNLILWYPDGIETKLYFDNARASNINTHGEDVYSIDILLSKTLEGNYLNRAFNKASDTLIFRVAFGKAFNTISDYKIVGVRKSGSTKQIDYTKSLRDVNKVELTTNELESIRNGIKGLLNDYKNFIALLGDPEEFEEDKAFYKESFKAVLEDQINLFNDLEAAPDKNHLSADDYILELAKLYPSGIKNIGLDLDTINLESIVNENENQYSCYLYTTKFFSGNLRDKGIYRENFELMFKFKFEKVENAFVNFKISEIDLSGQEFADMNSDQEVTFDNPIQKLSREGLYISAYPLYNIVSISDPNIQDLSIVNDNHEWTMNYSNIISGGVSATYFINSFLGISAGFEYYDATIEYNLTDSVTSIDLFSDGNGFLFNKVIVADYDSLTQFSSLRIPVSINYFSPDPKQIGYYFSGGIILSYYLKSDYNVSGVFKQNGYYPNAEYGYNYMDDPNLGFYQRYNINESESLNTGKLSISYFIELGGLYPIGYFNTISLGIRYASMINGISYPTANYVNIFGKESTAQPIKFSNIGIKLSWIYKF